MKKHHTHITEDIFLSSESSYLCSEWNTDSRQFVHDDEDSEINDCLGAADEI